MKTCPNCGKNVDNDAVRCSCGADLSGAQSQHSTTKPVSERSYAKIGRYKMTIWDIAFLFICNISFVLIIVDLVLGGISWAHFIVLGLFTVYFFAFACSSKNVRKLLSRYRNAVLLINFISGLFGLIMKDKMLWANNYFIPCNLILAGFVFLLLLFHKDISAKNVFYSTMLLLTQSLTQLILYACGVIGQDKIPEILIILAFGLNLMTLTNIAFLYFTKFKNHVAEKFHWWE